MDTQQKSHTSLLDDWERCKGFIEPALEYAGHSHTIDDVWDAIDNKYAAFFPFEKSAIVVEIVKYPQAKSCRIWLAGGDMDELMEAEKKVAKWAKSEGCDGMEIICRHGWKRQLKDYNAVATVLAKDL